MGVLQIVQPEPMPQGVLRLSPMLRARLYKLFHPKGESSRLSIGTIHHPFVGVQQFSAVGTLNAGATFRLGEPAEGIRLQEEGLHRLRGTGAKTHTSRMLADLAESYLLIGKPDIARTHLSAACAHRDAHGERYYAPELPRLQASLLELERAAPEEIEKCLVEALETARNQEATLHALRAATCLARFWSERGKREAARSLLAPVYASVTEGFDWPDVTEARAFLSHLHS